MERAARPETLLLSGEDVRSLLTVESAVAAVEEAFAAHGRGEAVMPPKALLSLPHLEGDFRAMPAFLGDVAGVKWVNAHPRNPERFGLAAVMGVFILSDPADARPLAVMDATALTAYRTGAAGAVAARLLARPGASSAGFIGCGAQAATMLAALRAVLPIRRLLLADASPAALERFQKTSGGAAAPLGEVAACDIVCTMTPARRPVLAREMVPRGVHINAMGADAPGKQELDPLILREARLFVDDLEQACAGGEVNVALATGELQREQIAGTIGQVVAGLKPGRQNADQITVFDSTGLALQDLALARRVYEAALASGRGTWFRLV
jgi:ornithine cyclodeaminase/alanine dehydrogenase